MISGSIRQIDWTVWLILVCSLPYEPCCAFTIALCQTEAIFTWHLESSHSSPIMRLWHCSWQLVCTTFSIQSMQSSNLEPGKLNSIVQPCKNGRTQFCKWDSRVLSETSSAEFKWWHFSTPVGYTWYPQCNTLYIYNKTKCNVTHIN